MPRLMTQPPPLPPTLDIARCFNDAVEVYKRNFFVLFVSAILFELLSICSLLVLAGPLWGGIVTMALAAMRNPAEPMRLGDLFSQFNRFAPLMGLFFIMVVTALLGTALLVLPGLAIMTLWLFPTYLMLDQNLTVIDSLKTSARIVIHRGFWINLALALIIVVIGAGPAMVPYLGWVVGWFLAPLAWLINTSAYIQEVQEQPGDIGSLMPHGFPVVATTAPQPSATPPVTPAP